MRCIFHLVAVALVALLVSAAGADDVTTTAGKKISGKLVSVDGQGITFATPSANVPIAAREIVTVDLGRGVVQPSSGTTYSEVELTDGSIIRTAKYTLKGKKFELEPLKLTGVPAAPVYEIPMGAVFYVTKRADEAKHRDAWKKVLASRGKRDLYVIQQEAGLTYVQCSILEGVEKDGTWRLNIQKEDGAKDSFLQSRAVGLVFYQPQAATIAPTLCKVVDVFGNGLNATKIAVAPEGVTVTTVAGVTVKYGSLAELVRLEYTLGNVAYLSDLR
jgi:hypothetical protein